MRTVKVRLVSPTYATDAAALSASLSSSNHLKKAPINSRRYLKSTGQSLSISSRRLIPRRTILNSLIDRIYTVTLLRELVVYLSISIVEAPVSGQQRPLALTSLRWWALTLYTHLCWRPPCICPPWNSTKPRCPKVDQHVYCAADVEEPLPLFKCGRRSLDYMGGGFHGGTCDD